MSNSPVASCKEKLCGLCLPIIFWVEIREERKPSTGVFKFELKHKECISIYTILSEKGITERGNRICKGPMEWGSMKEHSEQERLIRSRWHTAVWVESGKRFR